MFPITAAAGALSYLTSFLQSSTANVGSTSSSDPLLALGQTLGGNSGDGGDPLTSPLSSSGLSASIPSFDPGMLAALVSLQGQQANAGPNGSSGLLSQLDTNGDGQISKTEFESALGSDGVDASSADALFSKLDSNSDGSVSQSELSSAQHGHGHHHHHMDGAGQSGGSGGGGASSLLNATNADGSTTQTSTNADGSTTTSITYADGSTVDMTMPAAGQNGGSSSGNTNTPSQGNLIEQLIKIQSQLLAQSASTVSAIA
jgi:hypothetical protein